MFYLNRQVELTDAATALDADADAAGFSLLVRWKGVPVAFRMRKGSLAAGMSEDELAAYVDEIAKGGLLVEAIRRELSERAEAHLPAPVQTGACLITIAICTRDRSALLTRCLRSLELSLAELPGSEGYELLVIDNAPRDRETERAVSESPRARYLCEPKPGLDFARNRALQEASGEYVAFIDDDVIVDASWAGGLVQSLRENPDATLITGLVLPAELETDAQILFERRGGFRHGVETIRQQRGPGSGTDVLSMFGIGTGANMTVRRETALAMGGFDEALDTGPPLPAGGDLDFFYRVLAAGHVAVYAPSCLVFHTHRRELSQLAEQLRGWGAGTFSVWSKAYAERPGERPLLRRFLYAWTRDQLRRWRESRSEPEHFPPRLVLAELRGGLQGIFGEYGRSKRRVAERRAVT